MYCTRFVYVLMCATHLGAMQEMQPSYVLSKTSALSMHPMLMVPLEHLTAIHSQQATQPQPLVSRVHTFDAYSDATAPPYTLTHNQMLPWVHDQTAEPIYMPPLEPIYTKVVPTYSDPKTRLFKAIERHDTEQIKKSIEEHSYDELCEMLYKKKHILKYGLRHECVEVFELFDKKREKAGWQVDYEFSIGCYARKKGKQEFLKKLPKLFTVGWAIHNSNDDGAITYDTFKRCVETGNFPQLTSLEKQKPFKMVIRHFLTGHTAALDRDDKKTYLKCAAKKTGILPLFVLKQVASTECVHQAERWAAKLKKYAVQEKNTPLERTLSRTAHRLYTATDVVPCDCMDRAAPEALATVCVHTAHICDDVQWLQLIQAVRGVNKRCAGAVRNTPDATAFWRHQLSQKMAQKIKKECTKNVVDCMDESVAHEAVTYNHNTTLRFLVERCGFNLNQTDRFGFTLVHQCALDQNIAALQYCMQYVQEYMPLLNLKIKNGKYAQQTPLALAIEAESPAVVSSLLTCQNIQVKNIHPDYNDAVLVALYKKQEKITTLLVNSLVVQSAITFGRKHFRKAVENGYVDAAKTILKHTDVQKIKDKADRAQLVLKHVKGESDRGECMRLLFRK